MLAHPRRRRCGHCIAHSLTLPPQFLMFDDIDYDDLKAPIGARPPRPPPPLPRFVDPALADRLPPLLGSCWGMFGLVEASFTAPFLGLSDSIMGDTNSPVEGFAEDLCYGPTCARDVPVSRESPAFGLDTPRALGTGTRRLGQSQRGILTWSTTPYTARSTCSLPSRAPSPMPSSTTAAILAPRVAESSARLAWARVSKPECRSGGRGGESYVDRGCVPITRR